MDIKWGQTEEGNLCRNREGKLLVSAKGLEVFLHPPCIPSGTASAMWLLVSLQPLSVPELPCILLCVSVLSCLVAALLSVWYGLCSHLSWGAHEEFQSKRVSFLKKKGGNTVLFPAGITVHSGVRSWLHAGSAGSGAASTNRAVLGFDNNHCGSVWKGSDLAFGSVHTGSFSDGVCLPQNFVSESPNYLLRKPAEHLFALSAACASRGRRQSFIERLVPCLPHRNYDTVPLFPLLPHFFVLKTCWSCYCSFPDVSREAKAKSWVVENVSWLGIKIYPSLGLFWTGIKSSWELAQSHSWKIPF